MTQIHDPTSDPPVVSDVERRVLILAPVGRDGQLIAGALGDAEIQAQPCGTLERLCIEIRIGAACVIMTTEALDSTSVEQVAQLLRRQPAWSDLPVILLASGTAREQLEEFLFPLGNVTVLERPLRLSSLLSAARTALRARDRQYQMRDLLAQTDRARREAEEQQQHITVLNRQLQNAMTETHHRVKNNLQIIAAMIDLQLLDSEASVPIREVKRLSMHVRVLAGVHDLLTHQAKQDGLATHISVRAVLNRLIPLLQQMAEGRQIRFEVADLWFSARQSTSLAIVVNELVSNALKHGRGDVELTLSHEGDSARLEVCDDGPGFPPDFDSASAARTGLELIERLSQWDLSGQITYGNRPTGGARITICLPLNASSVPA